MLSMRIDNLIARIVRQELFAKDCSNNDAIHFHLDLRMSYHVADGKSYDDSCGLHLLYHRMPNGSYITVFSATSFASPFRKINEVKEWKHETTHDSCWRNINAFSKAYFDMAANINSQLVKDGLQEVAPIEMSEYNDFALFGNAFNWVKVDVSKDPNDYPYNYKRLVKLL